MRKLFCRQNTIRREINITFLLSFLIFFLLMAGGYRNFYHFRRTIGFFVVAEDMNDLISEMSRYEKNFFKISEISSKKESMKYAAEAIAFIKSHHEDFLWAFGDSKLKEIYADLQKFITLFEKLDDTDPKSDAYMEYKKEIQLYGNRLSKIVGTQVHVKLEEVHGLLKQMAHFPIITLLVMIVLVVVTIYVIDHKILGPLERITQYAQEIARGTFHRIPEKNDTKSEICNMIAALNRMMDELESRQSQLVQQCKIAAVGTLTSGIAHELNNPINNLSLIIESLIEDGMDMSRSEHMRLYENAMDQADRASEIVKNLLEFSRANHPRTEKVNIREMLDKIARLIKNEIKFNNIDFSLKVSDNIPLLYLDRSGFQQVFLNLFLNAVQAMGDGGKLDVTADIDENMKEVTIKVSDNGPGIAPEHLNNIFDPFFTTKKEGEGTGLGLSVSYNIIKKMGARIDVETSQGEGTCFTITLPIT